MVRILQKIERFAHTLWGGGGEEEKKKKKATKVRQNED